MLCISTKINGLVLTNKVFWPAFGCAQHPKAGQNTQHTFVSLCPQFPILYKPKGERNIQINF